MSTAINDDPNANDLMLHEPEAKETLMTMRARIEKEQ